MMPSPFFLSFILCWNRWIHYIPVPILKSVFYYLISFLFSLISIGDQYLVQSEMFLSFLYHISISEIQYRYIPHNIYIILYIIYLLYLDMPLFLSVQFWILERSILFFFFFNLSFRLFEWNQRSVSLWSELHFYLSFYSYPFLRADPL